MIKKAYIHFVKFGINEGRIDKSITFDNNLKEFINFLEKYNNILVFCKGSITTEIPDDCDLYIGVKQSIGVLSKKDILVMNDFEGLFGLEDCLKDIKYILFPIKPHLEHEPNYAIKEKLINYLNIYNFKGKIINYQITGQQQEYNPYIPYIKNSNNSGDIIFYFLNMCKNKKNIKISVMGMYSSLDDNNDITDLILNAKVHQDYIKYYKSYIDRIYKDKVNVNDKMVKIAYNSILNNKKQISLKEKFQLLQSKIKQDYLNLNINFI